MKGARKKAKAEAAQGIPELISAIMLIRHANDGNKYLYDLTTIKKETSSPLKP